MLILGGISGAGITTYLEDYRPIFMAVTFAFLGFAFYLTYRRRPAAASGPSRGTPASRIMAFNKVMLWAVTVIAVVFLFFPQAATSLLSTNDAVTADMETTVLRIEGMT